MKKRVKKRVKSDRFKKGIIIGIIIGVIAGIIASIIFLKYSPLVIKQEVRSFCDVSPSSLYGMSCQTHEDCYGRAELCNVNTHKCVISAKVDESKIENVRMPLTKEECESVSGIWRFEIISSNS